MTPRSVNNRARTKIVATMGPACSDPAILAELVSLGADVIRLNMAHGNADEHEQHVQRIRQVSRQLGQPVAILVDLAGPKIRLGELPGGTLQLAADTTVYFVRGEQSAGPDQLVSNYPSLIDELCEGDRIMLADAAVQLVVESRSDSSAACRVVQPGTIRSRQGVNLPGVQLSIPALGTRDREAARWAAERAVDFVGLSFVRQAEEVRELKQLLADCGSSAPVIAKIEKPEALTNLGEIVEAADGIMVARGDLGVEIEIAEVPLQQKRIISLCNQRQRPVIIATQMLETMQQSRSPTRAEVTDVANAVLDGGDACMLSGETAIGKYPCEAVEMMNRIAATTEQQYRRAAPVPVTAQSLSGVHETTQAVVSAAAGIAQQIDAALLVVATRSGATALALSKQRVYAPAIALSEHEVTLRKMCLYWGMVPIAGAPVDDLPALKQFVADWGRRDGCLNNGDSVVIVTGTGVTPGTHNAVEVHRV